MSIFNYGTKCQNLKLWTYVRELESDFPLPDSSLDNSASSDSVKETLGAARFCQSDSQESLSTPMSDGERTGATPSELKGDFQTSSRPHQTASPSAFKEKDLVRQTSETVSPQFWKQSQCSDQNSSASRMYRDSSVVPSDQENHQGHIFAMSFNSFPASGSMWNGSVSVADTLAAPSLEQGYCWLESAGALSHNLNNSRPPGQSRLEASLKKQLVLKPGECLNPRHLEAWMNIPIGWLNPSESRPATELLETREKPWEMLLTQTLRQSVCGESFTSTPSEGEVKSIEPIAVKGKQGLVNINPTHFVRQKTNDSIFCLTKKEKTCDSIFCLTKDEKNNDSIFCLTKTKKQGQRGKQKIPASGHLAPTIQVRKGIFYPRIPGIDELERRARLHDHPEDVPEWFVWLYQWKEKDSETDLWRTRSKRVPVNKLNFVRYAIATDKPISEILKQIEK